ncbi:copper chaperone PCu(A)C [Xinfangfangia sp. CPCC 101601]|uniref:Copper chaperone PCu(A)C n=1 Tax=Pseudogemmobacter lacusdianii TaxID=3069608 RepID=A0ABU0VU30_9RHOB|nr:copper chaperone PCu(A)C [Xinfangfangia sp. CPCC 101601]MDQ2065240.1 copper chaperone PCu(A)C [Xinfangfangia sp. CPCC 101601]
MKLVLPLLAAMLFSTAATAHSTNHGTLEIIHPNIPQPAATAKTAGGYMAISNEGDTPDRLIGVETEIAARAEVHLTEVNAEGIASMRHVEALEIPAGDTTLLEQGGAHVMLMGLNTQLTEGDMVKATLIFEQAGRIEIEFMIDPPGGVDHSKMDHSGAAEEAAAEGHSHH